MSAFEFFFSFYGLLLGFSVAELVGGFARVLHERRSVRFGVLTPLLAVFVAADIATFWVQAWTLFRNAPFNFALLILSLVVASVFYVAATLVFPRDVKTSPNLDDHFWAQRGLILLCVLGANVLMGVTFVTVMGRSGELDLLLGGYRWVGIAMFLTLTLAAALARGKAIVLALLTMLVLYHAYNMALAANALFAQAPWSVRGGAVN
ncbi:MAG: hypothetical protein AB7O98_05105 [Hyphomonadaceae bacterium]